MVVGLFLGIALAAAARLGPAPRLGLAEVRRPILLLMAAAALAAFLSGSTGAALVAAGLLPVPGGWAEIIPPARHVAFSAAAWAHLASYAAGGAGGMLVIVLTVRRRRGLRRQSETTPAGR